MRGQTSRKQIIGCAAAMFLLGTTPEAAQDSHYWTEQFGNRAYLLSGAVVGNPADLSAVYYNPGGLALNEATEFLLAGLGVEFTSLKVKDVVAPGADLSKSSTRFVPLLIAGEIPLQREGHREPGRRVQSVRDLQVLPLAAAVEDRCCR
jgi:hypothetical protein